MSDIDKEISEEIWIEILKLLPVKDLGKCRVVCKPWDSLIVSPSFINAHLKYYSQNAANTLILYKQFSNPPEKQEQYTLFRDSGEDKEANNLKVCHSFSCPFMATKTGYHFRVVGCVNGLVCLSDDLFGYTYTVLLWNPLIHKYIKLPVPLATYQVSVGAYICMLGFGYDSKRGDHKVVRLVYLRDKNHLDTTPPKVELYSVQDKRWRWVCADYLVDICVCDIKWSQCFLNGNIHWVAWERDAKTKVFEKNCLLLFDVEGERFKKMKLPEHLIKVNTLNLSVCEHDGKLSVIYSQLKGGFSGKEMERCEIWVKNEYNVGTSWCQVISLDLGSNIGLGWVQCLRKSGEVLGFTKKGTLVSYDPSTKQSKRLGFRGRWRSWSTCAFTESLVLLDKKHGVGTYKEAGGRMKKRFTYNIDRNSHAQTIDEHEVVLDDGDEEDPVDDNIYYQGGVLFYEALMKFGGGQVTGELSEFLSQAGLV
ncbi:F-box/kelch-repeat protein At3g23880-like [Silene latifolia]|uniref:F-box/kelch-repeat protein At3g23880-like n=1 Tax=Silene latifolia TaxID=37657 RepID=UPI003D77FEF9